jgi:hypothetical protein
LQLINPSTSPNELNTKLMPQSMIHGDACFAYFNKIWGIPARYQGISIPARYQGISSSLFIDVGFALLSGAWLNLVRQAAD